MKDHDHRPQMHAMVGTAGASGLVGFGCLSFHQYKIQHEKDRLHLQDTSTPPKDRPFEKLWLDLLHV
jgi:hypothetical protein